MNVPNTVLIHSIPHKIGKFSKVFMKLNNEWIASTKTIEEFEEAIKQRETRRLHKMNTNQEEV